jgi:hypothetical protein
MGRRKYVLLDLLSSINIELNAIFKISILAVYFNSEVIGMHEVKLLIHCVPD